MSIIRVVRGVGRAETRMASYDAALAAANVHNYNLAPVSSVIPAAATVEDVGKAPDLGPAGARLTVVEARATTGGVGTVSAGLGWATGPGPGLFYEAAGEAPAAVRRRVEAGLEAGRRLRAWTFDDEAVAVVTAEGDDSGYTTAVAVAVYGDAEPIL
jgi:arginine decarboxylase